MLAACRREDPDRVPWELTFTPGKYEEFCRRTGADKSPQDSTFESRMETVSEYFDFDLRYIFIHPTRLQSDFSSYLGPLPPNSEVNEWGIGIIPGSSQLGYYDYAHPLRNISSVKDLEKYPFPDVAADYRWEGLKEKVDELHGKGYAVGAEIGHFNGALFEPAYLMCGFEKMLSDLILNLDFAAALLDRINSSAIANAVRLAEAGVDVIFTGDDVGTERGMLMSPHMWREWLKPRVKEMNFAAKKVKPDLLIHFHSDGDIRAIIPDLIEVGVDILNPVQPECMDPAWVKKEYGKHMTFWGTVGTQTTMPFSSAKEVKAVIKERIETVGQGGGLVLAPTHFLEPDVPWENVMAFIEAVKEYGEL
jgi:uroporphyrinogen decarboxylase